MKISQLLDKMKVWAVVMEKVCKVLGVNCLADEA